MHEVHGEKIRSFTILSESKILMLESDSFLFRKVVNKNKISNLFFNFETTIKLLLKLFSLCHIILKL